MADEKTKPTEEKKEDLNVTQGGASQPSTSTKVNEDSIMSGSASKGRERLQLEKVGGSENKVLESPQQEKIEKAKPAKVEKSKKIEVSAAGLNLHASLKHCMYISRFIKNKTLDEAISDLQDVIKFKKIVPFRGEIPHRKGKGMMSGRYPIATSKQIISVLKGLKGNAIAEGFDISKTRISFANPSWASLPPRRGGGRFKRSNIYFKAMESSEPIKFSKKGTLKEIMRRRT